MIKVCPAVFQNISTLLCCYFIFVTIIVTGCRISRCDLLEQGPESARYSDWNLILQGASSCLKPCSWGGVCPWEGSPKKRLWAHRGSGFLTLGDLLSAALPPQVSGVGYNGKGTVCLLPSKKVIKGFCNVSVGKLVEVSVRGATAEIRM